MKRDYTALYRRSTAIVTRILQKKEIPYDFIVKYANFPTFETQKDSKNASVLCQKDVPSEKFDCLTKFCAVLSYIV